MRASLVRLTLVMMRLPMPNRLPRKPLPLR